MYMCTYVCVCMYTSKVVRDGVSSKEEEYNTCRLLRGLKQEKALWAI